MSFRSIARRIATGAAAVALSVTAAQAQLATYTFSGFLPVHGHPQFSIQFQGDASNVLDLSSFLGIPGVSAFATQAATANVSVTGLGSFPFDALLGPGSQYFLGAANGLTSVGLPFSSAVGFLGVGSSGLGIALFLPTNTPYDLTTSVGPLTGTAYAFIGPLDAPAGLSDLIPLHHTSFSATVTSTPEPASLALMATGLVGIAGVVRRRSRQVA